MERKRSGSTSTISASGEPKAAKEAEEEIAMLRHRVMELERQTFLLEQAAEDRERVVEHYRSKFVAMKKSNAGLREQAKGMLKALLDNDTRKLDELIRSHYNRFQTVDETADARALTPRGTHFRDPEVEARQQSFRSQDSMVRPVRPAVDC